MTTEDILKQRITELENMVRHLVFRDHPPSPEVCTPCENIAKFINKMESE